MLRKIGLFFLSLWLFFILTIIITVKIPICFEGDCSFIGFSELIKTNIIPILCILCLFVGAYSYFDFTFKLRDANQMPFKIAKIENINYEHLTFLTTYIVPLVCFNFVDLRYQIVLLILIFVIAMIYIKTDLFYANPTLALLNYKIYKVDGDFKDGKRENLILISRNNLELKQRCDYIKLDNRIYFVKPKKE